MVLILLRNCPVLVSRNSAGAVLTIGVGDEQFGRISGLRAGVLDIAHPTLELITLTSRSCRHCYGLVNRKVVVLTDGAAVVVIPIDVSLDFLIFLDVLGLQLNGVRVGTVALKIIRSNYMAIVVGYLRVRRKNLKGLAREDCDSRVYIFRAIPLHDSPVAEYVCISIFWSRCRASNSLCAVYVVVFVSRCIGAIRRSVVLKLDTLGANQMAAPLGIEVQLADGGGVLGINLILGIKGAIPLHRCLINPE